MARVRVGEVERVLGARERRVALRRSWLLAASCLVLAAGSRAGAQGPNACPSGFNDAPALATHLSQADIASGKLSFAQVFAFGQKLFTTNFNACDGAGRPGDTGAAGKHGVGVARTPDALLGPRFTSVSGPDSSSCASCHNEPEVGGTGSFRSNLFDPAADCDPVTGVFMSADQFHLTNQTRPCKPTTPTQAGGPFESFTNRGSLGLFGSGAIELLGREMTNDLLALQAQAIAQAQSAQHDVTVPLLTKGVSFGTMTAHADGSVDTSGVEGVSPDLVIRPFGRKGQNKSLRHFSVQAFNRHLGMQPEEAVADFSPGSADPDQDGVVNELTVGDITAAMVFQAALPVPRRASVSGAQAVQAARGEELFSQVGCADCHIPGLPLNSTIFCEPNPLNTTGDFRDTSQKFCFDLQQTSGLQGKMVFAFTDLKRHTICNPAQHYDPLMNHFCDDPPFAQTPATDGTGPGAAGTTDRPPYYQFLTAKLWDVGNSAPWGHRNDLDTIYEAIVAHGGEATMAVTNYEALSDADQSAVVAFLKTLQMPIMQSNPPPQQAGSPSAPNPAAQILRRINFPPFHH
jgi:hypothetical protein